MSDNLKKTVKPRGAAAGTRVTRGRARVSKDAAEGTGKSKGGAGRATPAPTKAKPSSVKTAQRLPRAKRQELVLAKAADYFAEHGLDAQTRAIAEVCGVSQRLLYSLFPSKAALIEEVYNREIAGIFKAIWFVNLKDRSVPLETRLVAFYGDYYETLLTRRWLRLFLYSSLEGLQMRVPTRTPWSRTHWRSSLPRRRTAHDAPCRRTPTKSGISGGSCTALFRTWPSVAASTRATTRCRPKKLSP